MPTGSPAVGTLTSTVAEVVPAFCVTMIHGAVGESVQVVGSPNTCTVNVWDGGSASPTIAENASSSGSTKTKESPAEATPETTRPQTIASRTNR